MKIIKAGYEIFPECDGANTLKKVERVARVCYKSEDKISDNSYRGMSRPRQHRHLKRKNSILFLVFLDFPHFFIHSGWQDTLF